MRILRRESRKRGHNNKKHVPRADVLAGGFSIKVVEMSTESKREGGYAVHLAQQ